MSEPMVNIVAQGRDREAQASKVYGFVPAIVTNINDPDKLGRVKIKFPWLSDKVETFWARVMQPMGGPSRGWWIIPEVDDEVLVGFYHGDTSEPYIIGSLYNGKDKPPQPKDITSTFGGTGYDHGGYDPTDIQDGKNDLRFFQSRSGHLLIFDDKDGSERITIADKTGKHRMEVHTADKRVVITSEDGDIELIADKTILLRCEDLITETRNNTEMTADAEFLVTSTGLMSFKTSDHYKLKAAQSADMKADMDFKIKGGMNVKIEAGMGLKCKGGMAAEFKAGLTCTIQGLCVVVMGGPMVKIN